MLRIKWIQKATLHTYNFYQVPRNVFFTTKRRESRVVCSVFEYQLLLFHQLRKQAKPTTASAFIVLLLKETAIQNNHLPPPPQQQITFIIITILTDMEVAHSRLDPQYNYCNHHDYNWSTKFTRQHQTKSACWFSHSVFINISFEIKRGASFQNNPSCT